jgi:putative FmdB family regulatory protein
MPTYEYECRKCKRPHEASQSITAKPLTKCPRRGCTGRLRRVLGRGSGFLFKGSGFYITDYRSKSYNEAKKKDQPATGSPSSSSGGGEKPKSA